MRAVLWIFLALGVFAQAADESVDREAIRKVLAAFNDPRGRASVLARDADLAPLGRFGGQEVSQVYFEAKRIRFLTPDVAFVDATASQYGSVIMKRAMPAYFVLRRTADGWRIAVMRVP